MTCYNGQPEHKILLQNINQCFLKYASVLHSTTHANVCVWECLAGCHSKIHGNENPLQSELENLAKCVGFYEVDKNGKLVKSLA